MSEWIDPELHRDFIAQQTDALRLCTSPDGWVERFGVDVLISHKTEAALERLKTELDHGVRLAQSLGLDVSDVALPF